MSKEHLQKMVISDDRTLSAGDLSAEFVIVHSPSCSPRRYQISSVAFFHGN
jgi:hypothetical protein